MSVKYAFIADEEGNYPIYRMCRWAKVSRSGFYEWCGRAPSATAVRRGELAALVRFAFKHSDGTSGYRRIHAQLARWGHHFDDETIRSVMRELGLVACQPRPFRPVTTIAGDAMDLPDLVRRDFTATAPGCKLVGDITYIPTWEGWLFLATVLNCFSKKSSATPWPATCAPHSSPRPCKWRRTISDSLPVKPFSTVTAAHNIYPRNSPLSLRLWGFVAPSGERAAVTIMPGRNRSMAL